MFLLNRNTGVKADVVTLTKPLANAVAILDRDLHRAIGEAGAENAIHLERQPAMAAESYLLRVEEETIRLCAGDDLGFIYGLLRISGDFLKVEPFWYWMDQPFTPGPAVAVPPGEYCSPTPAVRFRGWFFNDEVLFMKWRPTDSPDTCWKMGFEALLRCGGNLVIPGTDKGSRKNRRLAAEYGLWLTHHHAEPLGAEMFARAYPGKQANFAEHPELFYRLWEDAVKEQKDYHVVWNLCFRGQGDCPFWANDTTGRYDTPEKQGALIGELIEKQCEIVRLYVQKPVFCTNLYGEIMELYKAGYLHLDPSIIKVRADNGYGRMVTRRRDDHPGRVDAMPDKNETGPQGIYYHVSFYDLQAANHITQMPNAVAFVNQELHTVLENGGRDFWVVNCSNVRPHVYYMDAVRKIWFGEHLSEESQSRQFADAYFGGSREVAACYEAWPQALPAYGPAADEHCGEQYYNENPRIAAHQLLCDPAQGAPELRWISGSGSLAEQVKVFSRPCRCGVDALRAYRSRCESVSKTLPAAARRLFDATLLLQATVHERCAEGVVRFADAFEAYTAGDYRAAFLGMGRAAACYRQADAALRSAEYGKWQGFYANDCFADCKHTAFMMEKAMGLMRELGDNTRHDAWYRETCYPPEDQQVFLLLVNDNHMTDRELFDKMMETQ